MSINIMIGFITSKSLNNISLHCNCGTAPLQGKLTYFGDVYVDRQLSSKVNK